jgi:hypothetical protein
MRLRLVSLFGLLLLMVGGPSLAIAARPPHPRTVVCPSGHHPAVLADSRVQVYNIVGRNEVRRYVVCVTGRKRALVVSEAGPCSSQACAGIIRLTLAGPMLAYEEFATGNVQEKGGDFWITVQDALTGKVLHNLPTGSGPPIEAGSVGVGPAVSILVKSDGSAAWIAENLKESAKGKPFYEVHIVNRSGTQLLAAGSEIDPSSLALGGNIVYWTQGGKPYSAPLD